MAQFIYQSSRVRTGRRRLLTATILVALLVIADALTGQHVRMLVRSLGEALWSETVRVRSAVFDSGYFASHRALAEENAALRDQAASLQERASGYDALQQENVLLRTFVHLAQIEKGITAPVISSVISSPYGTFAIGAGESDGVKSGSLVLTEGGFVVGVVSDVSAKSALVKEVFAGGARIDVSIGGTNAAAEGRGGGNARAELPRGVIVKAGDSVFAPSLGARPVGVVGKVDSDPASASQKIYIGLPVNTAALTYVYVAQH